MRGLTVCVFVTMSWLLAACETERSSGVVAGSPDAPREQVYGRLLDPDGEIVPLAVIAANPARYDGRQVHTEGEIQQVCQKRGCWLELADAAGIRALVPMAGHAFTVPRESIGREAVVEGVVQRRERTDAEREHLLEDGAGDSIPTLSIEANAVVIR